VISAQQSSPQTFSTPNSQNHSIQQRRKGKKKANVAMVFDGSKVIWDGTTLAGKNMTFNGHNFGHNDSMKKVNFSGATLSLVGHGGKMTAFRDAVLSGADFSSITWGLPTTGFSKKAEYFFSGGPGTTSATVKHLSVTFAGAALSRITGAAKAAMIKNLGKFDGDAAIGAKYDQEMLTRSGWTAAELKAAGWQEI
jgi:uncharacterized protein YjbI with pentapeptide repeats